MESDNSNSDADTEENVSFQTALLNKSIEIIKRILLKEYDVKITSLNEINQCQEIVDICIKMKIDVNQPVSNYSTLLHFAIKHLDSETFRHLLTRSTDFDINALNQNGLAYNPKNALLHFAVKEKKVNLVKDLLDFGANVNLADSNQQTPLFYAVRSAQYEIVEILVKAKANVNAKNSSGNIATNYLFLQTDYTYPLHNGKELPFWEIFQLLSAHGANMGFNNKGGTLMLHTASRLGLFKVVKFLLKNGADLFSKQYFGDTVLHEAIYGYNFDLVDFLIQSGLDINAKNKTESTPLYELTDFSYESYYHSMSRNEKMRQDMEMIEFLIDNGANIDGDEFLRSIPSGSPLIMECLLEFNPKLYDDSKIFLYDYYENDEIETLKLCIAFFATRNYDVFKYSSIDSGDFTWMGPFFEECKLEFNRMKQLEIYKDSKVSYEDILSQHLKQVAMFCRNENIVLAFESGVYKEKFPLYKYFLEKRYERAQSLKHCMEIYTLFLNEFFKKSFPAVIMDNIFNFLKPGEIRNFGRASRVYPKICQ